MSSYIQLGLTPVSLKISVIKKKNQKNKTKQKNSAINSGRAKRARKSSVLFFKETAQQIVPRDTP